jgi:cyclase
MTAGEVAMTGVRVVLAGALACLALAVPAWGQARTQARPPELFDLQEIADGVFAALAKPRTPINCNAAVVVLDDGVLVVDTHSRPSSARALIAQIRTITDKPVTFAVNTHFHWDHAQGNHAYPVAFPKRVAIVASEATRESLRTLGGGRLKDQLASAPGEIAALEARLAKATDGATQARLKDEIAQQKDYLDEIKSLELTLPDLTFDKSLIIHRGDRRVVLLASCCSSSVAATPAATSSPGCRRSG